MTPLLARGLLSGAGLVCVAACASGSHHQNAALSSPSPTPSSTPATRTAAPAVRATPTPSPSASHAPIASTAAPQPTRTPSPSPRPVPVATSPKPAPKPSPTRAGSTFSIDELQTDRYSPSTLTLRLGDYVLVTNRSVNVPHTFSITALGLDSMQPNNGDQTRYRFSTKGTFNFFCDYHQSVGMTGTITVTG